MEPRPPSSAEQLAEKKNAEAIRLAARGRLYQALDLLNEAIRIAPSYPLSFSNRAEVFRRLGMLPQAKADRELAQRLAYKPPEPTIEAEPEAAVAEVADVRSRKVLSLCWSRLSRASRIAIGLIVLGGIVGGVVFALSAPGREGSQVRGLPSPTNVAPTAVTSTVTASPTPSPSPEGSPFSLIDLERAWEARGIAVTQGGPSAGFGGLTTTPFDVRLARGSDSMELSILVYSDLEAINEDWQLTPGQAPVLKEGRSLPDHTSIWWNRNIIVVVRSPRGEMSAEALDAFFALSP